MNYPSKIKTINQSLIKEIVSNKEDNLIGLFQIKDYCPQKIYRTYILKTHSNPPTASQEKGLVFEYQLLGGNAHGASNADVPLLKNGKMSIDYQRIMKQVDNAKILFLQNNVLVYKGLNCQVPLSYYMPELDIVITGELDLFSTILHEGIVRNTIIDLKLTSNVYSTFGDYGWGNVADMDLLQSDIYTFLVKIIFNNNLFEECSKLNPNFDYKYIFSMKNISDIQKNGILFHYFVFGYTDNDKYPLFNQKRIIERVWTKEKEYNAIARTTYAVERLREDEREGWKCNPSENNCNNCPLKDNICKEYPKINKI